MRSRCSRPPAGPRRWSSTSGDRAVPLAATRGEEPFSRLTSTPLAYGGRLYAVRDEGILMAASPVASDGRVFLATEDGQVHTLFVRTRGHLFAIAEGASPKTIRTGAGR